MIMSAGTYNMVCEQGATFRRVITWKDESGTPVNLTGYTALMQVRHRPGDTLVIELGTANGRITLGGSAGTITVLLPYAETQVLVPQEARYDLELSSPGGVVTRLLQGSFSVEAEVTV